MRAIATATLALGLGLVLGDSAPARAADTIPQGTYRLVLVGPFADSDLLVVSLQQNNGRPEARVLDAAKLPQPPQVTQLSLNDGTLTVGVEIGNITANFDGKPNDKGDYRGMIRIAAQSFPARFERTMSDKVTPPVQQAPPSFQAFMRARSEADPKAKITSLQEIVAKNPGDPTLSQVYAFLLQNAQLGGLDAGQVKKVLTEWVDGAKAYSNDYARDVQGLALQALAGQKAYATLTLELAETVEKGLTPETSPQARAEITRAIASAARAAGKSELATQAEERLAKIEKQLDDEYHSKVPPFKPQRPGTEQKRDSKRVVLLELFTGAQCPPCVAADVAFDALGKVFKPEELVTLQYHLHIPGPDPLTNADSEKRVEFYDDFGGTPTTLINGKVDGSGGGPLQASEAKFNEYRDSIATALNKPAQATIDLKVDRQSDVIKINASAKVEAPAEGESGKIGASQYRLRLALIEDEIRYTGSNNLRFHHNVVRAMPGGAEGKALKNGKGTAEISVDLKELRQSLETYLSDFVKKGRIFPKALPPIDLKNLRVVAFVQDDKDKWVLNAALVEVPEAK